MQAALTKQDLANIRESHLRSQFQPILDKLLQDVVKDVKKAAKETTYLHKHYMTSPHAKKFMKETYDAFYEVFPECFVQIKYKTDTRLYKEDLHTLQVKIDWS